jgi:Domain of unknown function (DUF4345)
MKYLTSVVITLGGLSFLGFGGACLFWPESLLAGVGVATTTLEAQVEVRSMYGGLELGLGILLLNCFVPARQRFGLLLSIASFGGLGLARLINMLALGVSTPFLLFALIWELLIALLALLALKQTK